MVATDTEVFAAEPLTGFLIKASPSGRLAGSGWRTGGIYLLVTTPQSPPEWVISPNSQGSFMLYGATDARNSCVRLPGERLHVVLYLSHLKERHKAGYIRLTDLGPPMIESNPPPPHWRHYQVILPRETLEAEMRAFSRRVDPIPGKGTAGVATRIPLWR